MADDPFVHAGRLFFFSSGEYSDYQVQNHFLALEDLTVEVCQAAVDSIKRDISNGKIARYGETLSDASEDFEKSAALEEHFIGRLIRTGKIMLVDVHEIHMGSYNELGLPGVDTSFPEKEEDEPA